MATISVIDLCDEGCHAIVEVSTSKGSVVRQIDFGVMAAERDVDQIADHILNNLRTAMRLGNTNPKGLAAMLNNRTFQE